MRNFLNRFGVPLACVLLLVAAVAIFQSIRGKSPGGTSKGFFLDTETNEVSVLPLTAAPPMPGKSGKGTVVRAIYLSCDKGKTKQIAYLMKYTERAKGYHDRVAKGETVEPTVYSDEMIVRLASADGEWVSVSSAEGQKIMGTNPCNPDVEPMVVNP